MHPLSQMYIFVICGHERKQLQGIEANVPLNKTFLWFWHAAFFKENSFFVSPSTSGVYQQQVVLHISVHKDIHIPPEQSLPLRKGLYILVQFFGRWFYHLNKVQAFSWGWKTWHKNLKGPSCSRAMEGKSLSKRNAKKTKRHKRSTKDIQGGRVNSWMVVNNGWLSGLKFGARGHITTPTLLIACPSVPIESCPQSILQFVGIWKCLCKFFRNIDDTPRYYCDCCKYQIFI